MAAKDIAFVIAADPPRRLDRALARDAPEAAALSRSRLAKLLEAGAVSINGEVTRHGKGGVAEGAEVLIRLPDLEELSAGPENLPLSIVHEDADLLIVDKPAGMAVHPAPGTPSGTLVNALLHHAGARLSGIGGVLRPGIVHRIDKDTSGLLVVAKSDAAHQGLAAQFAAHSVERRYSALCYGAPSAADPRLRGLRGVSFEPGGIIKITSGLARHRTDRQRQAVYFDAAHARHAVTRVTVEERFGTPPQLSLLSCRLETGRTHQIRVHLAHVGHGLIGDKTYGSARRLRAGSLDDAALAAIADFPRQALHAASLGFVHPVSGETLSFESALPDDFAALLSAVTHSTLA